MVRLHLLSVAVLASLAFGQSTGTVISTHPAQNVSPQHPSDVAACVRDLRADPKAGVLISDVILNGPVSISSSELTAIESQLVGSCIDENDDLIGELVAAAFKDRGFAQAEVKNVTFKASDALAVPKPVALTADVTEGPRFRLGRVTFVGNHAFTSTKLRAALPLKKGDFFQRSKIASGFDRLRKLYLPRGYSDLYLIPDVEFSQTGTVDLTVQISEGTQYRMGELKVYAKKEISDRLASEWQLRDGAVFNLNYPQVFIDESHSIPTGFGPQKHSARSRLPGHLDYSFAHS